MGKKPSKLEKAQQEAEAAAKKTNNKIEELGHHTGNLYNSLNTIQSLFDRIRNVPEEEKTRCEKLKAVTIKWKQQAEAIEMEYKKAEGKIAGKGAAGIGAGVAVVTLGPTAAMGIATTFGVASTGTAISALSGAAATNAALAWLGGGALAAGGGGMAAGSAFLALAGPVGWTIAGISLAASGLMFFKAQSDKEKLENIFTLISKRDVETYELAFLELSERIKRIDSEADDLTDAASEIGTFGTDYSKMSEAQQYKLGAYVNLMEASAMLLVDPIPGLQPKYTEQDFKELCKCGIVTSGSHYLTGHKSMIIYMANMLYKIDLDDEDKKLLARSLNKNKEFLSSVKMSAEKLDADDISIVEKALKNKFGSIY